MGPLELRRSVYGLRSHLRKDRDMAHELFIDIETYSSIPLAAAGAYAYCHSDDFEILLFSCAVDDEPVQTYDLACGDVIPDAIIEALTDASYTKRAFNAAFEWTCLSAVFGDLPIDQWKDTMLHAMYCGYPGSLEAVGEALGLGEDKKKLSIGRALVRYFCMPCKPTKANGGRTRNLPHHDPEKWALFKTYNAQDVVAEMAIDAKLAAFQVPENVEKQWQTDRVINARGVAVDMDFVHGAIDIAARQTEALESEAVRLTGLSNPNSVAQLKDWLEKATGETLDGVTKATVAELYKLTDSEKVKRVLELRQELGKTSNTKYDAIEACVGRDGRVRGLLQFYGANRTGRWAGRLVQVQNLPRTYVEPLDDARELVKAHELEGLAAVFGSVNDTLSQLIRTAFTATPGQVLIDADFSAIEARVISWLACEEWRLEVFRTHGKIYEASASQMFGVPIERIKKGNPEYALRQRGKVAELALGYQGGVNAMRAMDTGHQLDDLSDDEIKEIVTRWRNTNSAIRKLWRKYEDAAKEVITDGGSKRVLIQGWDKKNVYYPAGAVTFRREWSQTAGTFLTVELPSGRKLFYINPRVGVNRFGDDSIIYDGVNQQTRQFMPLETYGGKITENVVQAVARDCLAVAIERLEWCKYPVVFHVHDEVIIDRASSDPEADLQKVVEVMTTPISWAPGLPLNADGWTGGYYRKE